MRTDKPVPLRARNARDNYRDTFLGEDREPSVAGDKYAMWRVQFTEDARKNTGALVGLWLLSAIGANVMYDYYACTLTHLRPDEGLPDPIKLSPDAAYEVSILALDPQQRVPHVGKLESLDEQLYPLSDEAEVLVQFARINGGDDQAYAAIGAALTCIVEGRVVPVDDYRVQWSQAIFQCVLAVSDKPPMEVN